MDSGREVDQAESLFAFEWQPRAERPDEEVKRALEELPDELRLPLLLSSLVGLSLGEVGSALGTSEGTVTSRLLLARRRLHRAL